MYYVSFNIKFLLKSFRKNIFKNYRNLMFCERENLTFFNANFDDGPLLWMFDQILRGKFNYKFFFKIEAKVNQSYIIRFHTEKTDLMKLSWNYDMNIFRNTVEKCHLLQYEITLSFKFQIHFWMKLKSNFEL